MIFRTLQKCSSLSSSKSVYISLNPVNGPGQLISNHTFYQSFGSNSVVSSISIKTLTWTLIRDGSRKACNSTRYRKIGKFIGQHLTRDQNLKNYICENALNVCRKNIQRDPKRFRNLTKVTLASALLVPKLVFTNVEEKIEERAIPIDIPKEVVKTNKVSWLSQLVVNIYEFTRVFLRALRLFVTFVPILTIYPVVYLSARTEEAWWGLLLRAIEFSGSILIKLGQWASTRRDLFPDVCCRQFSRLQRRIDPHPWSFTVYRMKKAFGANWRKVFVKFDNNRNPIGSGCIAQVYKVWMDKDAVSDDSLLEEIVSDMDDDILSEYEGLEILQLKKFLHAGEDEDKVQEQAIEEWRKEKNLRKLRQQEMEKEAQFPNVLELDVSSVTESLASDIMSGEGFQPQNVDQESKQIVEEKVLDAEVEEHSLVEEWEEADLDKSLPTEEAPPEDMESLIPVAVKVLHPSIHSYFKRDLRILRACAWFISSIYPPLKWLSLPQCVDEFAVVMSGQINLRKEAENMELFAKNFADVTSIKFPRPIRPYVTQKVIVETYEEGEGMGEFIGSSGEDKPDDLRIHLAQIGVDALLKMVFIDNLVHGDLHPGNMLIQNINLNGDNRIANTGDITRVMMVDVGYDTFVMDVQPDLNPLRICILDCGVVARLKEKDLTNFKNVFKQIALGNGESVADLFLENSEHNCKDEEVFKAEMTNLVENARQNTISLGQVDVGVLLQQVLGILLRHQVRLESAFSAVVLAVFILEGLGRTLDPNMDILERARPMLVTGEPAM